MPDELMADGATQEQEFVKPSSADILSESPDIPQAEPREDGGIFDLKDTLLAVPRGIVGAAKDAYGLVDTVAGDSLPDWDNNPLGESTSTIGGITEVVANFAAGFIPVAGWLGKAGKVGRVLDITLEAEEAARTAEKLAGGAKLFGKAGKIALARNLTAGAITDFAVWDGHEERLSNFIEQFPALQNPVTEFLAAKGSDSEIVGRLKGAVEGLGLGAATDLLILGAKSLKAGRRVLEEGGTKEAAEAASEAAVSKSEYKAALKKVAGDPGEVGPAFANIDEAIKEEAPKVAPVEPVEVPLAERLKRIRNEGSDRVTEVEGDYVRPRVNQRLSKGLGDLIEGRITPDEFAEKMAKVEADISDQKAERTLRQPFDRTRGIDIVRERLAKAKRTGFLNEDGYQFANWLLDKNPELANDLSISLSRKGYFATGQYAPIQKLVTLFKGAANNPETAVHEFLHHTERLLPDEIQEGIKQAWRRDLGVALKDSVDRGDTKVSGALQEMLLVGWGRRNEEQMGQVVAKHFKGPDALPAKEYYRFFGPSEYWAVTGSELLQKQFKNDTWLGKASEWLKSLWENAKEFFGLKNDSAVRKGIDSLFTSEGDIQRGTKMLTNSRRFFNVEGNLNHPASPLLRKIGLSDDQITDVLKTAETARPAEFNEVLGSPSGAVKPRDLSWPEKLMLGLKDSDMSWKVWDTPQDASHVLGYMDQLFRLKYGGEIPAQTLKEQGTQALQMIVDLSGSENRQTIMAMLGRDLDNASDIRKRAIGYAFMLESHTRYVLKLAQDAKAASAGSSVDSLLKLKNAIEFNGELQFGVKALRNEQGRALGSNRIRIGNLEMPEWLAKDSTDPAILRAELDKAGGAEALGKLADQIASVADGGFNLKGVTAIARASRGNPTFNMLIEYWMNALLGGPKTLVVNVLGPTINSIYTPLETLVGSGFISSYAKSTGKAPGIVLEQQKVMKDLVSSLTELTQGGREAMSAVKKMGFSGEGLLTGRAGVVDPALSRDAITAAKAGVDPDSAAGSAIDWIGKIIRVPTRILSSSDEFVRQANYRARALGHFSNEALEKGLRGDAAAEHVMNQMDRMVWEHQAYSSKSVWQRAQAQATAEGAANVSERAQEIAKKLWDPKLNDLSKRFLNYSGEIAFTTPAPAGTVSNTIQRAVALHPYLRLVVPFVNTPLNLIRFTGDRVNPLNPVRAALSTIFPTYAKSLENGRSRLLADFVSKDPERKASAVGRMVMGTSISAYVYAKANDGTITGRGPSDPEQRKTLMEAGWQPYSIKTANGYVSYARLDPLATVIGSMADIADYAKFAPLEDEHDMSQLANGVLVSMANNFTNKSYLTGVSNFIEMLEAPDRKLPRFLQRMAGSFVPNYLGQSVLPTGDDEMRDVRSILDAVTNRIPGLSSSLPPERNALGEPVKRVKAAGAEAISRWVDLFQPVVYREVSDDVVKTEMANLRHGFTPPKRTVSGMDLGELDLPSGQNAYDRWGELTGTLSISGLGLKDALRKEILSADYKKLSDISTDGYDSPRINRINSILRKYRDAAYKKLLNESPELYQNEKSYHQTKRALSRGLDPRILPPQ